MLRVPRDFYYFFRQDRRDAVTKRNKRQKSNTFSVKECAALCCSLQMNWSTLKSLPGGYLTQSRKPIIDLSADTLFQPFISDLVRYLISGKPKKVEIFQALSKTAIQFCIGQSSKEWRPFSAELCGI